MKPTKKEILNAKNLMENCVEGIRLKVKLTGGNLSFGFDTDVNDMMRGYCSLRDYYGEKMGSEIINKIDKKMYNAMGTFMSLPVSKGEFIARSPLYMMEPEEISLWQRLEGGRFQ
jgi:hypothetical protein